MSNCPPGVTGHEPQIAGGNEITIDFECHATDRTYDGSECGFVGIVEAIDYPISRDEFDRQWTCPACGSEYTDVVTFDDDEYEPDRNFDW